MKHFFRQIEDIPLEKSPVNAEVYFRGANATGLIEKHFGNQSAVLLFVNGEPGLAYLLEENGGRSMSLAEFSSLNDPQPEAIHLPDVAGRLLALALESQTEDKLSFSDAEDWKKQSSQWKRERWSGLMEIKSENSHGFVLYWQGESQPSDLIFSTPQGFVNSFPSLGSSENPMWTAITYSHHASAQAYQYAALRQGAMHWSHEILSRYQEMVGQKLLQVMNRELNRQIQPWRWHIVLDGGDMLDSHFFPYLMDAAHAYRSLFMTMGAQMNFVIGNTLTQKLLTETFQQVHPDERVVLQSQRLVPAAFSE
ncbi:MAG: hypothetical protein HY865_11380 [Chloroflexi bacterium]|nr:hypothetical protein [Chloroflexota bacterium]